MIVVTGALGFIPSVLVGHLNQAGFTNLLLVDDFSKKNKFQNIAEKSFEQKIERSQFIAWFEEHAKEIEMVFHLGARTDTTEFDVEIFNTLNLNYSKSIWNICTQNQIPLIYASSAATYGDGALGYNDSHEVVESLKPLNPYGESKNNFDIWALKQQECPPHWYGLKFFNVYGPNEYHKGRMASVVFHAFNQIQEKKSMQLFRSHRPDFKDGMQLRDFVYVKDVAQVMLWLHQNFPQSGLYNLGTGKARAFLDLAKNTFKALELKEDIRFIDTPLDIRDKYQYFTEANMDKLKQAGYPIPFHTLEEGVQDYVQNYLLPNKVF